MTTTKGTYTRLKDGDWGVRIPDSITPGPRFFEAEVTKRNGETKTEIVQVFWSGNGPNGEPVSLALIRSRQRYARVTSGVSAEDLMNGIRGRMDYGAAAAAMNQGRAQCALPTVERVES